MISVVQGEADNDDVREPGHVFEAVIQPKLDPLTISERLQIAIWQLFTIHYQKLLLQSCVGLLDGFSALSREVDNIFRMGNCLMIS